MISCFFFFLSLFLFVFIVFVCFFVSFFFFFFFWGGGGGSLMVIIAALATNVFMHTSRLYVIVLSLPPHALYFNFPAVMKFSKTSLLRIWPIKATCSRHGYSIDQRTVLSRFFHYFLVLVLVFTLLLWPLTWHCIQNHISAASIFFSIGLVMVHNSHPYTIIGYE